MWPGKKGEQRVEYQDIEANLPVEQILPNRSCTALGRWVPSQVLLISKVERFSITDNVKHKCGTEVELRIWLKQGKEKILPTRKKRLPARILTKARKRLLR